VPTPAQEPVAEVSPLAPTVIHSVSADPHDGVTAPAFAAVVVPVAHPPASGGLVPCAAGIAMTIMAACPAGVPACTHEIAPVSVPVDHLYAAPTATVGPVVDPKSANSVHPAVHDPKEALLPVAS
jgi:hypothetical protein